MQSPERLVEGGTRHEGRFPARPSIVNPIDAYRGPRRAWRRLRLRLGGLHAHAPRALLIDDHSGRALPGEFGDLRGRPGDGTLQQHAANARGGSPQLPAQLYGGHCQFAKPGYRIEYFFDNPTGQHRIRVDIAATSTAPAFAG